MTGHFQNLRDIKVYVPIVYTLIPLQQLKGPNSKVFLLSLSVICCIPLVTQIEVVNQTPFV